MFGQKLKEAGSARPSEDPRSEGAQHVFSALEIFGVGNNFCLTAPDWPRLRG